MSDKIEAPFTPVQVASLNAFQKSKWVHPFTCGNDHAALGLSTRYEDTILVADRYGWHCPVCSYLQSWAHADMGNWSWKIMEQR